MSLAQPENEGALFQLTEREQSQLPAVALLTRLGYRYLLPDEALELRGGRTSRVILHDILLSQLQALNRIHYRGQTFSFTGANIRRAIQALEEVPLSEGTQRASEQAYDLLRLGKSLEQSIAGDTKSFTLRYIDWETPENNVFHATTEYRVQRSGSQQALPLDVVLFVNGIPFVVIECKAPGQEFDQAVSELLRDQHPEYLPELFRYVQILLALKPGETRYATPGASEEFWATWRSRTQAADDEELGRLLRGSLPEDERAAVLAHFVRERAHFYATEAAGREVTAQDRALYNLCRPERLLELARQFVVYEGGVKKLARYQQYYAVQKAMAQIQSAYAGEPRPGGVVWHTQGSGKTLTMVFLANALALERSIENPRIVLVSDRVDLDKQLWETFQRCGMEPRRATSGADLRRAIQGGRGTVITTLIQKFDAAVEYGELVDPSREIFVLVDESHRTQYGELHRKMRKVFPNACYVGFTGTPLTREQKNTIRRFGGRIIDVYPMVQAVEDRAVVPLLYERRHIVQEVQDRPIDSWFDRYCQGLTEAQQFDLKRKFSRAEMVSKTDQRLGLIAFDVSRHYAANWQRADGHYKAQVVAPDKKSALRLHHHLRHFELVSSDVIISPPDIREGYEEPDHAVEDVVQRFWSEMMAKYGSEERYNDRIIENFGSARNPEILIVVDKLITGFDEPRNTILYLARRLTSHTLLQAIARVNRLHPGKDFGHILDYSGVLGELDRALNEYAALSGYDEEDLKGILNPIRDQVNALPQKHAALWDLFKTVRNRNDAEEYERLLADEALRRDFYEALSDFAKCLHTALASEILHETVPEEVIDRYRADLKRFRKLRQSVQLRYSEVVSLKRLEPQIEKLLDTYVTSDAVEVLTREPVNIFDTAAMDLALDALGTPAAKADTIAFATARTITERMDEDPARYRKFSEMLQETIRAFREQALSDLEYLNRIRQLRDQLVSGAAADIPERLAGNDVAQAYHRSVVERLDDIQVDRNDRDLSVDVALMLYEAIHSEVVVDWRQKPDVLNRMRARIDDGFFELCQKGRLALNWDVIDAIAEEALRIAKSREE
jgi:type I restriction enzyme R subunit